MEELARNNPTGYRLLYVLQQWAGHLTNRSAEPGSNPRGGQLLRIVTGIVPHLADDILQVPEPTLRNSLEQIITAVRAVLDGLPASPAPTAAEDAGGGGPEAG